MFPFASLNPNAGRRLATDILLLPHDSLPTSSHVGDAQTHDYMPLPIIPIVTNHDQETMEHTNADDSTSEDEHTAQNLSENG